MTVYSKIIGTGSYLPARRVSNDELAAQLAGLLARPNDWIITSSEALRGLVGLLRQLDHALLAKMQQQHVIVPHARIADAARALGLARITLTGSGDERLLAALQSRT